MPRVVVKELYQKNREREREDRRKKDRIEILTVEERGGDG